MKIIGLEKAAAWKIPAAASVSPTVVAVVRALSAPFSDADDNIAVSR
jgi:hypothetical protein